MISEGTMRTLVALMLGMMCVAPSLRAEEAPSPAVQSTASPAIEKDMSVQLEYTLTANGQVVDSTEGHGPFQYVQGKGQIIPGLERQLAGLHVGDQRDITVSPEEGYGAVDPSAFVDVPREQLPTSVAPKVGMVLRGTDPDGRQFQATIRELKDQTVTLDLNHPLAGKTLLFKVKVVGVSSAHS